MKNLFQKIMVLFMAVSMILTGITVSAVKVSAAESRSAAATSGSCGISAIWAYNADTKELTVKGTGKSHHCKVII